MSLRLSMFFCSALVCKRMATQVPFKVFGLLCTSYQGALGIGSAFTFALPEDQLRYVVAG